MYVLVSVVVGIASSRAPKWVVYIVIILKGSSYRNVKLDVCVVRGTVSWTVIKFAEECELSAIGSLCDRYPGSKCFVVSIVLLQFK